MSAHVEDQLRDYFGAIDAGQDRITVTELEGRTPDEVPLSDAVDNDGSAGRRRRWLVGALAVAAATILVVTLAVIARDETGSELNPTEPSVPTAVMYVERLAFAADGDIYTMNPDGSNVVQLTDDPDGDRWPVWSPDGTRIVFESTRDGAPAIYVMDADGSNQTRLTTGATEYNTPSWSPDGARIIATRWGECRVVCTVIMDADGTNEVQLRSEGFFPRFSPDGTKIMFEGGDPASAGVLVMDADGTHAIKLTDTSDVWERFAVWSPDGSQIAFTAQTRNGDPMSGDIHVMNADGTGNRAVVAEPDVGERVPAWSPDGTRLVYARDGDLYIVDVATSIVTRLTDTPDLDENTSSWALVPMTVPGSADTPAEADSAMADSGNRPEPFSGITFVTRDDEGNDGLTALSIVDPDGSDVTTLLDDLAGFEIEPVWSPDGTQIAYSTGEIFVVDNDGTDLRQLTKVAGYARDPSWSPDGTRVAFATDGIYTIAADGTDLIRLTPEFHIRRPVWSPDGTRIAFEGQLTSSPDVHVLVVNVDGTELTNLTIDHANSNLLPTWSPDGTRLVFASLFDDDIAPNGIFSIAPDGTGLTRLTTDIFFDDDAAEWSPDGTRLAFGDGQITVMNPDGTGLETLVSGSEPHWSPDGTRLVYSADTDGDTEIYTMKPDGSDVTRLTDNDLDDHHPTWSPTP